MQKIISIAISGVGNRTLPKNQNKTNWIGWINQIRKSNKFNLVAAHDISMKSLTFGFKNNIIKAFDAGCNIILHCNGNIKEMNELAKISPKIDSFTLKKTSQLYKFLL